ncbi:hypothetical protein MHI57_24430 [Cytobacillus sp. FSL K6-0129]|uniref:hypothetical protein n=1 Tax=unclassified Cytobacillus TaxID=2675268 RepID=UPI0030FB59DC
MQQKSELPTSNHFLKIVKVLGGIFTIAFVVVGLIYQFDLSENLSFNYFRLFLILSLIFVGLNSYFKKNKASLALLGIVFVTYLILDFGFEIFPK